MKFETPLALVLFALFVPLAAALHVWAARRSRTRLALLVAPRLSAQLLRSVDFVRRRWKAILFALGVCAVLFALARPQLGFETAEVERASVDFFIAIDLSRSMLAEDVETRSRLAAAKAGISHLLERIGADRVGLVAFAGEAFLAAPITEDHAAVRRNLDALDPASIAKPGSDIASAIKLATKTFASGTYETKALVIVTDGEELQGDAIVAARDAALQGVRIFAVGVGSSAGARVPARGGGVKFARNEFGREVISRLNARMLQQVAASGRGSYEALGKDGEGLVSIWQRGLTPLAKGTKRKTSTDRREYFQWPLALALSLFLGEMLVNDRRKRLTA